MKNDARINIRLPKQLKNDLKAKCEAEERVINKLIIRLLENEVYGKGDNKDD